MKRTFDIHLTVEHDDDNGSGMQMDHYQRQLVLSHLMEDVTNGTIFPGNAAVTSASCQETTRHAMG